LSDIYPGAAALQVALVAIRRAGVPPLIQATDGKSIFLAAGCAACHTLAAAGSKGTLGPSFDAVKPSKTTVVSAVTNGQGEMFSFNGLLTADQIHTVAEFVNQSAGT
jgi:mono/diheme cytochrome c family protein